ncbi:TetR/AcrR family transcriptional regulator [Amycolatopsis sp. NBC_01286]|uniref:TetR/AcrR family transcriptional regulator n=1 Tax=Amycolatopsis sp. NBC_01286 TaxID=2903560 RepID=UPI002E0FB734|nr:TetR/AcrR family transcriptional regulator [Amycolatopsis sp. NBC_01286]
MTATRTARERARAELTQEIKDEARRQLAEVGANGLSLRAVARELGMVSSALYRYFPSRDRLLTDLIVDAYNAIGEAAEGADPGKGEPRERWLSIWLATREWAKAHPHEYALIYGSPIPGYQAPQDTVAPAARVALALVKVLTHTELRAVDGDVTPGLRAQAETLTKVLGIVAGPETVARLLMAWTQLFGAINFDLFGQYVGSVDPADEFFAHTAKRMAEFVGL